ncbi:MAG: slipin family protein, partial [Acetatifactor sp.]|nr:slipin family protein [Acetatifactor sp.]
MKYIIRDNQAGFVLKNGVFRKMITAGTYHFSKMAGYTVVIEEMLGELNYLDVPYQVLSRDPAFLEATVHMEIPDGSVGFLYMNGKLTSFANRKEYVFWNVFDRYEMRIVSMAETVIGSEVSKQMLTLVPKHLYTEVSVGEGETGLVYYDNVMQKPLSKGVYRFWNYCHVVSYCVLDMKQKEMDIVGQEILTRDKIGIRMNVACMYKIRDAVEFVSTISDLKGQLYPAVQLVIREIVGNYKLDEILEAKEQISGEIYEALKGKEEMFCVTFLTAGIKDIIL